jgi:phage N-6-adenine-methyltransferase
MSKFTKTLWTSNKQNWNTPKWLFDKLNAFYNFTTDPSTVEDNPLGCPIFFTPQTNGLDSSKWEDAVYINPEYSNIKPWVNEAYKYFTNTKNSVVLLVPSRTGNRLWQDLIFPTANLICFIRGRLRFSNNDNSAPFDSALIVYGINTREEQDLYREIGQVVKCVSF